MNIIESLGETTDNGTEVGKEYISKSYEYAKLKTFKITALSISMLVKMFLIGGLLLISFIFLSVAASVYLGDYFNSLTLGLIAVGSFYLILAFIFYLIKGFVDRNIIRKLSENFLA